METGGLNGDGRVDTQRGASHSEEKGAGIYMRGCWEERMG